MEKTNPLIEDKKQNIDLFSDINDTHKFSKYSNQLNKIFASYSYSKFFNTLTKCKTKKPITLKEKINEWLNLSNYSDKIGPEDFNMDKFRTKLKEMELKELLSIEKRKKNNNTTRKIISQFTKNKILKIKNKTKLLQNPCLGVYNPSYESIGKHTYQVSFGKKTKSNDKKNNSYNGRAKTINPYMEDNNKKQIRKIHRLCCQMKYNYMINENDLEDKKIEDNNDEVKEHNINKLNKKEKKYKKQFNNNEELLFFPKLRKHKRNKSNNENNFFNINTSIPMKNTLYNNTADKINFNPNNKSNKAIRDNQNISNIKGMVKFDKISSNRNIRGYFEELAKKNQSPPVGLYHPTYSSIFRRTTNVFIKKRNNVKQFKTIKKYLLNKIITNYNQTEKLELFDTLNKTNIHNKDKYLY
jgi:hypothetical protein